MKSIPLTQESDPTIFKTRISLFKGLLTLASFLLFVYILITVIQFFFFAVSTNVTGGWDARYFWTLKAKFMFRSPEDWQAIFAPPLFWAHPDYPLLWPGILLWGWHWLGHESLIWGPLVSLCFYISCSLLLAWYLAAHVSSITGWLAGAFSMTLTPPLFWSIHQYADVPLTFFITAGGLLAVTALRADNIKILILSGLMAGMASWTKNEGFLFMGWIILILAGVLLKRHKNHLQKVRASLLAFALGASIPLLTTLLLKCFLGTHGDYLGSGRSLKNYLTTIFSAGEGARIIFGSFYRQLSSFDTWKGAWMLFAFAVAVLLLKRKKWAGSGIFVLLIIAMDIGYILAILVSPLELKHQIQTALERLIIHSHLLALAFSFETLTFTDLSFLQNKNGQTAL